jgi:hypothetical protein
MDAAMLLVKDVQPEALQRVTGDSSYPPQLAGPVSAAHNHGAPAERVTIGRWRALFVASRLEQLADETRPGQPRKISDEQVAALVLQSFHSIGARTATPATQRRHPATRPPRSSRPWHAPRPRSSSTADPYPAA